MRKTSDRPIINRITDFFSISMFSLVPARVPDASIEFFFTKMMCLSPYHINSI